MGQINILMVSTTDIMYQRTRPFNRIMFYKLIPQEIPSRFNALLISNYYTAAQDKVNNFC